MQFRLEEPVIESVGVYVGVHCLVVVGKDLAEEFQIGVGVKGPNIGSKNADNPV